MQRLPSRGKAGKRRKSSTLPDTVKGDSCSPPQQSPVTVATSAEALAAAYSEDDTPSTTMITPRRADSDVFENAEDDEAQHENIEDPTGAFADGYEELPIEIQSLMERFLESLASRAQPTPLSVDRLAELYQSFYEHAQSQINTHIAALSTKLSREVSPAPSGSSGRSSVSRGAGRAKPQNRKGTLDRQHTDQQLLTASEVTDRRKQRRQLEVKRLAMEEAVERGVCEKVYPRLWRHQSTDDEARDEKLRSRAAALAVVGVDLKELLSSALSEDSDLSSALKKDASTNEAPAKDLLSEARSSLEGMNGERSPLGKLNHLVAAHKAIVEALQQMFPSASSADEVLPTLIYTIITSRPESSSVVSNFNFIQRFRTSSKIDGETAYCLTNLEAAISFLETVDLSSIRSDETPGGAPSRSPLRPATPQSEKTDPLYRGLPSSPPKGQSLSPQTPSPGTRTRPRAFSGQHPFEAASNAVRSGANDIQSALDGGFKFLFGRLREKQAGSSPIGSPVPSAPKTLEDARRLVSQDDELEDENESIQEGSLPAKPKRKPIPMPGDEPDPETLQGVAFAEEALRLVNGPPRDRSVDSNLSGGSLGSNRARQQPKPFSQPGQPAYNPVESMRTFGNALNPFKGFGGMSMTRSFGRTGSAPNAVGATQVGNSSSPAAGPVATTYSSAADATADDESSNRATTSFDWGGIAPPISRFVQCSDARELNHFDVELLLRDYQRLAGAADAASKANGDAT